MKKVLLSIILAFSVYYVVGREWIGRVPDIDTPSGQYVVVYGRNTCGYTARMREQLDRAGIGYEYKVVDDHQVASSLHERMRSADVDTRRYNLPVVEVNGYILVRPEFDDVFQRY